MLSFVCADTGVQHYHYLPNLAILPYHLRIGIVV